MNEDGYNHVRFYMLFEHVKCALDIKVGSFKTFPTLDSVSQLYNKLVYSQIEANCYLLFWKKSIDNLSLSRNGKSKKARLFLVAHFQFFLVLSYLLGRLSRHLDHLLFIDWLIINLLIRQMPVWIHFYP